MPTAYGWTEVLVDAPTDGDAVMGGEGQKNAEKEKETDGENADGMEGVEEAGKGVQESSTAAAGPSTAAEDTRLPSAERQRQSSSGKEGEGQTAQQPSMKKIKQKRYYVGEEGVNVWRAGMEVGNMMTDGISTSAPAKIESLYRQLSGTRVSSH